MLWLFSLIYDIAVFQHKNSNIVSWLPTTLDVFGNSAGPCSVSDEATSQGLSRLGKCSGIARSQSCDPLRMLGECPEVS